MDRGRPVIGEGVLRQATRGTRTGTSHHFSRFTTIDFQMFPFPSFVPRQDQDHHRAFAISADAIEHVVEGDRTPRLVQVDVVGAEQQDDAGACAPLELLLDASARRSMRRGRPEVRPASGSERGDGPAARPRPGSPSTDRARPAASRHSSGRAEARWRIDRRRRAISIRLVARSAQCAAPTTRSWPFNITSTDVRSCAYLTAVGGDAWARSWVNQQHSQGGFFTNF